ncbi:MAG: antibiotic biosynthesis monooxygenase [Bacteroidales bacterium]
MFASCIHIRVKEEFLEPFIQITRKNHIGSRSEAGNHRFDILRQVEDPCRFMLYEVWDSENALEEHRKTAHYQEWKTLVEPWMAEPRRGIRHSIIEPTDPSSW